MFNMTLFARLLAVLADLGKYSVFANSKGGVLLLISNNSVQFLYLLVYTIVCIFLMLC